MDKSKEEINKKYAEAERRMGKKDYTGNILYLPFDPEEEYFYILNSQTRSLILDQLNGQFDVQDKLNISKRTTALDIVFKKGEAPLPVYVFCRYTKGKLEKSQLEASSLLDQYLNLHTWQVLCVSSLLVQVVCL